MDTNWAQEGFDDSSAAEAEVLLDFLQEQRGRAAAPIGRGIGQLLCSVFDRLATKCAGEDGVTGLATGLGALDAVTGGLQPGSLTVVAARPGMGKTSLALTIASNVAKNPGNKVLIFTGEGSDTQITTRLLAMESTISPDKLFRAALTEAGWNKLEQAGDSLCQKEIVVYDGCTCVEGIRRQCEQYQGVSLVVVDSLPYFVSERKDSEAALRALKAMAEALGVSVVCTATLPRSPEKRRSKYPLLSDFAEQFGDIGFVDTVMLLYREAYYDLGADKRRFEVNVARNACGSIGRVCLSWNPVSLLVS